MTREATLEEAEGTEVDVEVEELVKEEEVAEGEEAEEEPMGERTLKTKVARSATHVLNRGIMPVPALSRIESKKSQTRKLF